MNKKHHRTKGIHYTWITDNLAVGGFLGFGGVPHSVMLKRACELFDIVVLCAADIQPEPTEKDRAIVIRVPIVEHLCPIDEETKDLLSKKVPLIVKAWTGNKKMLCCCALGAARSPLVATSILTAKGMDAKTAVELIREKRAFSNFAYYDYILNGQDEYETKWLPTFEQRREDYWRRKD